MVGDASRRVFLGGVLAAVLVRRAVAAAAALNGAFTVAVTNAVRTAEREDSFSGVILIAHGDQVLLREAVGFANREQGIRNTPETKFPIESVSKQFTAAAIMLLIEDHKISLDDPIAKYYPASPAAWNKVTIKHLLTHGSGMDDWLRHPEAKVALENGSLSHSYEELIRIALDDPLLFEPGAGHQYSNEGYALVTAVIERASGQKYGDFLRARIFEPLNMRDSGYDSIPGGVVRGYVRSPNGEWIAGNGFDFITSTGGAGGIYSTLDDMLIWSRALENNRVLSATSRTAMFTDYGFSYGFGSRLAPKFGRKLIWHTGGGGPEGFAAIFDRFPEDQLTVVVMTNNTGPTEATATLLIEGKVYISGKRGAQIG
jgi:D-alanyl-D-alanine carboxypeptidase